jgi:hypothetical protein
LFLIFYYAVFRLKKKTVDFKELKVMQQNTMEQGGYGGELKEEAEHPWHVKYGIRALGTFAGGCKLTCILIPFNLKKIMSI